MLIENQEFKVDIEINTEKEEMNLNIQDKQQTTTILVDDGKKLKWNEAQW